MATQKKNANDMITLDEKVAGLCSAADSFGYGEYDILSSMCLEGLVGLLEDGDEKGRTFLGNAFSLQMLADPVSIISVVEADPADVPKNATSVIGHVDTAKVVSGVLGWEVPYNRASIQLQPGDVLFVAQLQGGRLPEGVTSLPEGFSLGWRKVVVR